MIKRVQQIPEGIRVISDNKEHEPYKLLYGKDDFAICGRVLRIIKDV